MSNMICIWFEMVLYAEYDYIRNGLIRLIHIWIFKKRAVFAQLSSFSNLYNASVKVNETVVCCRSLLGLQSPTLGFNAKQ